LRPPQVGVPSELDSVCREAQLDMIVFPTTERARTLTATILQIRAFSTDWAELCSLPSGGSGADHVLAVWVNRVGGREA